jgi:hypothetical protein
MPAVECKREHYRVAYYNQLNTSDNKYSIFALGRSP